MADRAIAVHVVVLDDRLVEQVVAEALDVAGVVFLALAPRRMLRIVSGLGCVVSRRGVGANLVNLTHNLLVMPQQRVLLACQLLRIVARMGPSRHRTVPGQAPRPT